MKKNLFESLPQEITIEIISRLPIDTIARCKCVCKAWRKLIDGSEFATSHRSKSMDSYIAYTHDDMMSPKPYKVCAFDGSGSATRADSGFGFPCGDSYNELIVNSSANGLLLFEDELLDKLLICNPITREYTELPRIPVYWNHVVRVLGFGASKASGQCKVVVIYEDLHRHGFEPRSKCEVYSLGLGLWRRIEGDWSMQSSYDGEAVFLNGNLHFMVNDGSLKVVSCFDLETELFTASFPSPRGYGDDRAWLRCLDGRLCLFDCSSKDEIFIWFMNKYGDGNSWVKEYVVKTPPLIIYGVDHRKFLFPIKVFKDSGNILFGVEGRTDLFIYANSTKAIREYGLLRLHERYPKAVVFTPSFLSLRTMGIQDWDVESF